MDLIIAKVVNACKMFNVGGDADARFGEAGATALAASMLISIEGHRTTSSRAPLVDWNLLGTTTH